MDTSTNTTIYRMSVHMNSFIILSCCMFSSILLCLYAIYHNRPSRPMSSMFKQKINTKSSRTNIEQSFEREKKQEEDILTSNDSNNSDRKSFFIHQTTSMS